MESRKSQSPPMSSEKRDSIFSSTRRRLLEQALLKDNLPTGPKQSRSISTIDQKPSNFEKLLNPLSRLSQDTSFSNPIQVAKPPSRITRSKSPSITKRIPSLDLTKNLISHGKYSNLKKLVRGKSTEKIREVEKKPKATDNISKIVSQFSIAKVNVSFI